MLSESVDLFSFFQSAAASAGQSRNYRTHFLMALLNSDRFMNRSLFFGNGSLNFAANRWVEFIAQVCRINVMKLPGSAVSGSFQCERP